MGNQGQVSLSPAARRAREGGGRRRMGQGGFIVQMVIIGIVLLGLVMAYISKNSKGSSSQTNGEQAKLNAQSIVKIGQDLQVMAQRFSADHSLSTMTLDTTADTGLYDPAQGLGIEVLAPGSAMTSGTDTAFTYDKTGVTVTGLMTASADYVVRLDGVSDAVCQRINALVNSAALSAAIPATAGALQEGCAAFGASSANVYYKVIQAN